ncbi:DUF6141 family protein [Pontibacter sp. SGAir0037]|uniref:DUF6141 family protein n=1 Tax=Pontibacter sp. SGAir0037 TaxID=2571030 RepID=UPI0010CD44DA|nr:DUF6141 family protein [Pontibacter sp. SGAir0037]QCR24526.1 hypothetical protein C1N53_20645 [Pontibacter sp. SGAir0037]
MAEPQVLFKEKQRFRQIGLWLIVLAVAALFWAGFVYQVMLGYTVGNNPVGTGGAFLLTALFGTALPLFFYRMSLTTQVEPGLLKLRFWPFHLKAVEIPLHLVRDYEQVVYEPIHEYGGWGIRWTSHGKAYNVSGQEGVKLHFYNQKPILIGSQYPEELFVAVRKAKTMQA